jgi:hypothetical protein
VCTVATATADAQHSHPAEHVACNMPAYPQSAQLAAQLPAVHKAVGDLYVALDTTTTRHGIPQGRHTPTAIKQHPKPCRRTPPAFLSLFLLQFLWGVSVHKSAGLQASCMFHSPHLLAVQPDVCLPAPRAYVVRHAPKGAGGLGTLLSQRTARSGRAVPAGMTGWQCLGYAQRNATQSTWQGR